MAPKLQKQQRRQRQQDHKKNNENDTAFLSLEVLPDDVFSLILQYAYMGMATGEKQPDSFLIKNKWREFMTGLYLVSKTMMNRAIAFTRTAPAVDMSMIKSPMSVVIGCKFKLRPKSLVLVDGGHNIPIFAITKYLLESIDISLLNHLTIEEIWRDGEICQLKRLMKHIMFSTRNRNSDESHDLLDDPNEGFHFDASDEIADIGDIITNALEEKKDDLRLDSLSIESGDIYSYERLVQACSHTLTTLNLNCMEMGGNLSCCQLLKNLTINIRLMEKNNYRPLILPPSIEHLSMHFTKLNHSYVDLDDTMKEVSKTIKGLPHLKSLTLMNSVTWTIRINLHIESESLERIELPKDFNVDIARCICPSLKEIELDYDGVALHDFEGYGKDLVTFDSRIVPQVLQPMYKKEFIKCIKVVHEKDGFTSYCISIKQKTSNDLIVHDDCIAKFKFRKVHQEENSYDDLDEYDRFVFDSDSEGEGDFLAVSSYLAQMRGLF